MHLIPEAIEEVGLDEGGILKIFLYLLLGFCTFFILEQFINWHHHHSTAHPEITSFSYLILASDAIHNFIDGFVIAASFVIAFPVGIVTVLAVILHEIPQELGDFGVLIYGGFKKSKALFLNFVTGLLAVIGGIAGFFISIIVCRPVITQDTTKANVKRLGIRMRTHETNDKFDHPGGGMVFSFCGAHPNGWRDRQSKRSDRRIDRSRRIRRRFGHRVVSS